MFSIKIIKSTMKTYYLNSKQIKHSLNESNDITTTSSRSKTSILFERIISFQTLGQLVRIHKKEFSNSSIINENNNNILDKCQLKHRSNSISSSTSLFAIKKKIRKDAFGILINKINKSKYRVSFADRVSSQPLVEVVKYIDTQKMAKKSIEEMQTDNSICCCFII